MTRSLTFFFTSLTLLYVNVGTINNQHAARREESERSFKGTFGFCLGSGPRTDGTRGRGEEKAVGVLAKLATYPL